MPFEVEGGPLEKVMLYISMRLSYEYYNGWIYSLTLIQCGGGVNGIIKKGQPFLIVQVRGVHRLYILWDRILS